MQVEREVAVETVVGEVGPSVVEEEEAHHHHHHRVALCLFAVESSMRASSIRHDAGWNLVVHVLQRTLTAVAEVVVVLPMVEAEVENWCAEVAAAAATVEEVDSNRLLLLLPKACPNLNHHQLRLRRLQE